MIVIPGPGVLFVVGRALSHGRRTALATARRSRDWATSRWRRSSRWGSGRCWNVRTAVFVVVKIAGAVYLVWLGIHAIRHRKSLAACSPRWLRPAMAGGRCGTGSWWG